MGGVGSPLKGVLPPMREQRGFSYLILGDFNLHHPVWGGDNAVQDGKAEDLLELMDAADLDFWLPPGTITREDAKSRTSIDLVMGSHALADRMVACEVNEKVHADSDHLPIYTY